MISIQIFLIFFNFLLAILKNIMGKKSASKLEMGPNFGPIPNGFEADFFPKCSLKFLTGNGKKKKKQL